MWHKLADSVVYWIFGDKRAIGRAVIVVDSNGDEVNIGSLFSSMLYELRRRRGLE